MCSFLWWLRFVTALTSLGRSLPGRAHVKNKIKRVDRALGNPALHEDISLNKQILTILFTSLIPFCVIAVDWTGWHDKNWHLLRASLICDGRSLPLMSVVVPAELAQNSQVQCAFLDRLHAAISYRWYLETSYFRIDPEDLLASNRE